jgi:hypothetical protein
LNEEVMNSLVHLGQPMGNKKTKRLAFNEAKTFGHGFWKIIVAVVAMNATSTHVMKAQANL